MKEKKKLSDSGLYQYLQKRRKNIMIRSVLLALFVLGVNIYAWFIYFTEAQVNITGNVVSWDVSFRDENSQVVEKEIIELKTIATVFGLNFNIDSIGSLLSI